MNEAEIFELTKKIYGPRSKYLRLGQWAFGCLYDINREIANDITNTDIDPFYHDDRVDNMLQHLLRNKS